MRREAGRRATVGGPLALDRLDIAGRFKYTYLGKRVAPLLYLTGGTSVQIAPLNPSACFAQLGHVQQ